MRGEFVRSSPSLYANSLPAMTWKDREEQIMDKFTDQLQQYIYLSSSLRACVSAVEKHSQVAEQVKGNKSSVLPAWTSISATRSKHFSIQDRRYIGCTSHANLWSYLHDHGEDMRKWDGKLTSILEEQICELQGKTIPGKWPFHLPVGSSPNRVDGLTLFLSLITSLLVCIHEWWIE